MAQVELRGITKRFGSTVAVDDLSLTVEHGQFVVLLGPSGCGKTTVLRLVAGFERPTEGSVSIDGRRVDDVPPKDRDVAMVFQSYALYPHKTAYQNVEYPLRMRSVPKTRRDAAVRETAHLLSLDELLDRRPAALSGGQRQRVALARAIVRDPAVFLMDEPLSNLDAKLRQETRAELSRLHRRLDATILYVTHDQVEAMTMATLLAVMHQGRLQQLGTPQEVYDRPANLFVAQFVGSPPMNLLPAGALEAGADIVGVRPEHLRLDPAGPLAATVSLVEALGHERLVTVRTEGGADLVLRVTGDAPGPEVGDTVHLDAEPRHRHRFDPVSGARREP